MDIPIGYLRLSVTLLEVSEPVTRVIDADGSLTLGHLHQVRLTEMG